MIKRIAILMGFLILVKLSGVLTSNLVAENYHKRALTEFETGDYTKALYYADKSIKYKRDEPTYFVDRAKIKIAQLGQIFLNTNYPEEERVLLLRKGKSGVLYDLDMAVQLNKYNLVTKRNALPVYYFLSFIDYSKSLNKENIDDVYLEITRNYFSELVSEYSLDLGVLAQVAQYQKNLDLSADFENTKNRINDIRPEILEWYIK